MMKLNDKNKKLLGKFIRLDRLDNKRYRRENEFDATKPSVLIGLTLAYIAIVLFLVLGIPWMGVDREPIPPEDLPVAIPIFILFYLLIVGGLYLRDRLKK